MELGACNCIATEHNVVDITVLGGSEIILYSMDVYHEPFSTTIKSNKENLESGVMFGITRLNDLSGDELEDKDHSIVGAMNAWAQRQGAESQTDCKPYSYSLESLRKRGQEDEA